MDRYTLMRFEGRFAEVTRPRWGYTRNLTLEQRTKVPLYATHTNIAAARRHDQTTYCCSGTRPISFVRLQADHFLSQTHSSQALCELRSAYSGRGLLLSHKHTGYRSLGG
jgi:hypothetical protein